MKGETRLFEECCIHTLQLREGGAVRMCSYRGVSMGWGDIQGGRF